MGDGDVINELLSYIILSAFTTDAYVRMHI